MYVHFFLARSSELLTVNPELEALSYQLLSLSFHLCGLRSETSALSLLNR